MFNSMSKSINNIFKFRVVKIIISAVICSSFMATSFVFAISSIKDADSKDNNKSKLITILQSVEHPALTQTRKGIIDELMESSLGKNNQIGIIFESAQGNMSLAQQISKKFISKKPDAIVSISTSVSQILVKLTKNNKIPVAFSSVTDPISSNLVKSLERPGSNITGVSNFVKVKPQLEMFKEVMPNLRKLGFIYNAGEINSIKLLEATKIASKQLNIELITASANKTSEVSAAASSIIDKVDAIFITNDNTALAAFKTIVKTATCANKPVFVSDVDIVEQGALLALGPNQYQVGRLTGKILLKILNGEAPAIIPVGFPKDVELFINKSMAKKLNIKISESIIKKADKIIGEE